MCEYIFIIAHVHWEYYYELFIFLDARLLFPGSS